VLKQSDFEYLGAFNLPQEAAGWSTGFGGSGLAHRYVSGKLRLITGTHRYGNDALYEVEFPGWGSEVGGRPTAKIVTTIGVAGFVGKKAAVVPPDSTQPLHGLCWDESRKRLYYSFASWYNTEGDTPSLGFATLGSPVKGYGPWKSNKAHCQKVRGGSLLIPQWFADKYTGGRSLGLGFGGSYSIWAEGSKGPHLSAVKHPTTEAAGTGLDTVVLVDYPGTGTADWAKRNTDYTNGLWCPPATTTTGYWTGMDTIYGSCAWIDLPEKHGVVYVATLGHGKQSYEAGTPYSETMKCWWFVYDPKSLSEAAAGTKKPWQHTTAAWQVNLNPDPYTVLGGNRATWEIPGITFDPATRTLFVLAPYSYKSGVECYPIIHGYKVK
jgi:hypothetical protein